ncbi:MAG: O-antigen ligase family protein [Elusimicrobiales bacterium]|nr:O-antigen ligase family protein [Elusimicrobiales bacterium]
MEIFANTLLGLLLFFAPFSFAATEPWSFSILQSGIVIVFILVATKKRFMIPPLLKPVLFMLGFLAVYSFVQSFTQVSVSNGSELYPTTLIRLFTLEHTSLFLTWTVLVFSISQLSGTSEDMRRYMRIITLCGLAVMLCVAVFPGGGYIKLMSGRTYNGVGPFFNRNHAAVFMGMISVIMMYMGISGIYRHRNATKFSSRFITTQACISITFIGMIIAIIATRSRGGSASTLAGILCFAAMSILILSNSLKKKIIGVSAVAVTAACLAGLIITNSDSINRYAHRERPEYTRTQLYTSVPKILKDWPIWGIGTGSAPIAIPAYTEKLHDYVYRFHNDWLEMIAGTGIFGFSVLLCGFLWFALTARKILKRMEKNEKLAFAGLSSAMLVMLLGSLVDFHFFIPSNAYLFFMLTGLLCSRAIDQHYKTVKSSRTDRILMAVIIIISCITPFKKAAAWRLYQFGKELKAAHKFEYFEKALRLYPSPLFASKVGLAYLDTSRIESDLGKARNYKERAMEIEKHFRTKYPFDPAIALLSRKCSDNKGGIKNEKKQNI